MTSARIPARSLTSGFVALVTLGVLAGCGAATNADQSTHDSSAGAAASSAAATPASGPHNDADVAFAQQMIPHHTQAVTMSDTLLTKSGVDPDVLQLAREIKAAQAPEITRMSGWLAGWGAAAPTSMPMDSADPGMSDGMMSAAEMQALAAANGNEAAKLYLSGMIKHHQGAITMATTETADGQNTEAKQLAASITTSQQAQITTMKQLLTPL